MRRSVAKSDKRSRPADQGGANESWRKKKMYNLALVEAEVSSSLNAIEREAHARRMESLRDMIVDIERDQWMYEEK